MFFLAIYLRAIQTSKISYDSYDENQFKTVQLWADQSNIKANETNRM